jgi:Fe-S cluster assembly scaffold protein SufB
MNPATELYMEEDSVCEMEMVQIKGVDSTVRTMTADLGKNAKLTVTERLMTHGNQMARSDMEILLNGENASAQIISRSVGRDSSEQIFNPIAVGNNSCRAHIQCDSIIMDDSKIRSIPEIAANHKEAQIVHEAAIGRINGDQLLKLQTLGLTADEAEKVIIDGFLK